MTSINEPSITELFFEISLWYRRALTRAAAHEGLSPPQAALLWELAPGAPVAMSALAAALECDAANVTGLANNLEGRGLVVRAISAEDRRVKLLTTTRSGSGVRARLVAKLLGPPEWLSVLSVADQRELLGILGRARTKLGGHRLDAP